MMILVRLIDWLVEWVKYLGGAPGHRSPIIRILAWLYLIFLVVAAVVLIAWLVSKIPEFVDFLNRL